MVMVEKAELFGARKSFYRAIDDEENVRVNLGQPSALESGAYQVEVPENYIELSGAALKNFFLEKGKGDDPDRVLQLATLASELSVPIDALTAKQALKADKKGRGGEFFLSNFGRLGNMECNVHGSDWTLEAVEEAFRGERRFKGRVPQIADVIASVSDKYGIPIGTLVSQFNVPLVKGMRDIGVPDAEVVVLYGTLPGAALEKMKNDKYMLRGMASLLSKGILDGDTKVMNTAMWVANHYGSDAELIAQMMDSPGKFKLGRGTTVEAAKVQSVSVSAIEEIKKLEKAYKKPGFKFSECVCEMKMTEVTHGRYNARILEGNDPRQVMLGYETSCCQHLGDAGETAMMHGLLNPKAGFFTVTDKDTGRLRAQAEVWEADDETIVFDNIEFADDTEIDRYKDVLCEWLLESGYKNAYMGCGYNAMGLDKFGDVPPIVPPVTARELYVMSYEEDAEIPPFCERTAEGKVEGDTDSELLKLSSEDKARKLLDEKRIDYYDYVYSDVDDDKGLVWLKKDWELSDWFEADKERESLMRVLHSDHEFAQRIAVYAEALFSYDMKKAKSPKADEDVETEEEDMVK